MKKSFKIWFGIASAFLLLSFLAHALGHYVFYINESSFDAERATLATEMKNYIADKMVFETSMWTLLKMFSMSFSLLFLFAGLINLIILTSNLPEKFLKKISFFNLVFWFFSFVLFSVLNPAIQPISICAIASILFGTSFIKR